MALLRSFCSVAPLLAMLASQCSAQPLVAPKAVATYGFSTDKPAAASQATKPIFNNYGGPVIAKVKVFAVYWGYKTRLRKELNSFYHAIARSSYVGQLKEYSTATQRIKPGAFIGSRVLKHPPGPRRSGMNIGNMVVTNARIQSALAARIRSGALPRNAGGNVLFAVHLPPHVTAEMGTGQMTCRYGRSSAVCAYHSFFDLDGEPVYYHVVADMSTGICATSCGGGSKRQLDRTTASASHELAEAITDPEYGRRFAWVTDFSEEIADVCNQVVGRVGRWLVQKVWSVKHQACVLNRPRKGHGHG